MTAIFSLGDPDAHGKDGLDERGTDNVPNL